jgi:hypothetical protein
MSKMAKWKDGDNVNVGDKKYEIENGTAYRQVVRVDTVPLSLIQIDAQIARLEAELAALQADRVEALKVPIPEPEE